MDTNILLENGTNELEVLEFTLGDNHYGINVAKVKEIIQYQEVTPIPNASPCVEGVFMPRDIMITAINLKRCIGQKDNDEVGMFVITNFNQLNIAFHVDQVLGIHRISWSDIITPDATVNNVETGVATGIIKMNDKLIVILDFEKIVTDINPETGLKLSDIDKLGKREKHDQPVIVTEDSQLLSALIVDCLHRAGYTNTTLYRNGMETWTYLQELKEQGRIDEVALLITDIEMPIMDGHRLIKLVKSDSELKNLPIVIFSSLINEEMMKKGEALGANAQLTKPEIGSLIEAIDGLLD